MFSITCDVCSIILCCIIEKPVMYRFYNDVIMFFESKNNFHRLEISKASGDQCKSRTLAAMFVHPENKSFKMANKKVRKPNQRHNNTFYKV